MIYRYLYKIILVILFFIIEMLFLHSSVYAVCIEPYGDAIVNITPSSGVCYDQTYNINATINTCDLIYFVGISQSTLRVAGKTVEKNRTSKVFQPHNVSMPAQVLVPPGTKRWTIDINYAMISNPGMMLHKSYTGEFSVPNCQGLVEIVAGPEEQRDIFSIYVYDQNKAFQYILKSNMSSHTLTFTDSQENISIVPYIPHAVNSGTVVLSVYVASSNGSVASEITNYYKIHPITVQTIPFDLTNSGGHGTCVVEKDGETCSVKENKCIDGADPKPIEDCTRCVCLRPDDDPDKHGTLPLDDFKLPKIDKFTWSGVSSWIHNIQIMIIAIGVISSIFIIPYIVVLFASASPENIKKGKDWLVSLITGVALLTLSSILIELVGKTFSF